MFLLYIIIGSELNKNHRLRRSNSTYETKKGSIFHIKMQEGPVLKWTTQ